MKAGAAHQLGAKSRLTLRLQTFDSQGGFAGMIGVGMTGFSIRGNVEEGDWVEVAKIKGGGRVKSLFNLTTGVRVKTKLF